ncbi:MAG: hydantoinase/oxoprolinase family protein [Microbacterium sp.]|uniref:hydantoinase/oxoprolinase N-terminal domain-containing protein n=1 Tax=Microbacterium sp. TaxID=51671 RepID=UPI0039E44D38
MSGASAELHLGVACSGGVLQLALVTADGNVLESRVVASSGELSDDLDLALGGAPPNVRAIMIATDRLRGALEGSAPLARVATLRISGPVTDGVPVLASWPEQLLARVSPVTETVAGAVDGRGRELVPFDEEAAERFFGRCRGEVDALAVSSMFAPLAPEFERRAAAIAARVLGDDLPITMSHSVAGFGLLDRESAATLNAALTPLAAKMLSEIDAAIARHGSEAEVFLVQNDGTLAVAEVAASTPILLLEGVAASNVYGAALLADASDAVVLGNGPDRTGVVREGFVVMTSAPTRVAGVRLNVELPVGAGSSRVPHDLGSGSARRLVLDPQARGEDALRHSDVAAAYGCALAPVGAVAWMVSEGDEREAQRLHRAKQQVVELAITAGADPVTAAVTSIDAIDISQATNRRLRIRATGRPLIISRADRSAPSSTLL